jgi:hypothetical protein
MISGSPLWLLDTVLADAEQRGRATVQEGIDRIRAGEREQIKPRGQQALRRAQARAEVSDPTPEALTGSVHENGQRWLSVRFSA